MATVGLGPEVEFKAAYVTVEAIQVAVEALNDFPGGHGRKFGCIVVEVIDKWIASGWWSFASILERAGHVVVERPDLFALIAEADTVRLTQEDTGGIG